ncbi:hypothetical protein ABC974_01790 [Sphingomonas oligophenolica]|uniref:Uncharacterized protein n=1 Tax=Sphingomonas oligophenolica TaxID=301154 RepID=A0ABU9XXV9_9SPHN
MTKLSKKRPISAEARVLGDRAFAAITAIEGIALSLESQRRFASMRSRNLTPQEQRAEIIRAYADAKRPR